MSLTIKRMLEQKLGDREDLNSVFHIMPYGNEYLEIDESLLEENVVENITKELLMNSSNKYNYSQYWNLISKAFKEFVTKDKGKQYIRADYRYVTGILIDKVLEDIVQSKGVLIDLTRLSPNVLLEAGITRSLKFEANVIFICQEIERENIEKTLLRHEDIIFYNDHQILNEKSSVIPDNLKSELKQWMSQGCDDTIIFRDTLSDYWPPIAESVIWGDIEVDKRERLEGRNSIKISWSEIISDWGFVCGICWMGFGNTMNLEKYIIDDYFLHFYIKNLKDKKLYIRFQHFINESDKVNSIEVEVSSEKGYFDKDKTVENNFISVNIPLRDFEFPLNFEKDKVRDLIFYFSRYYGDKLDAEKLKLKDNDYILLNDIRLISKDELVKMER